MAQKTHRKRAFLFLAAVLLPSAVLVGTTVHLIRQERELAVRRAEEDRSLLAREIGQGILVELGNLGARVEQVPLTSEDVYRLIRSEPALLTIATPGSEILVFPWELGPRTPTLIDQEAANRHASLLGWGSEAEHRAGDFLQAAGLYGRAAVVENIASAQAAEARLHQARALRRGGRTEEAREISLLLSQTPPFLTDIEGMPFILYGLDGLHQTGADLRELANLLEWSLDEVHHFSPTALLFWQTLADEILVDSLDLTEMSEGREGPDEKVLQRVMKAAEQRAAALETLERLRADFTGLRARVMTERRTEGNTVDPIWMPHGDQPWLVGFFPGEAGATTRVAVVRPEYLLGPARGLASEKPPNSSDTEEDAETPPAWSAMTLLPPGGSEGYPVGPGLNGLRVSFPAGHPAPREAGGVEGWFFQLLLPIILLLTGFTAFIAWRDVKREAEAVRLRSQFVSGVTHELKTPLTSIRMFAETLRLGRHAGPKAQQEYLDTLVHETERLSRLINNVLDFARIDRGEKTYHMAPADVGAAAREAARAVAYPLSQGGYTLNTVVAADLPWIQADSDALTQAILNLLTNAIKFSEAKSVIGMEVFTEGGHLKVQVKDHGCGIASEDQKMIFDDFFRTATAEQEGVPGTGLGLSLVAHVAQAHGGDVSVDSQVGRGSTFTIRIPVVEDGPEKEDTP